MTRLGWLHEDNLLARGGMVVYGFALTELQKALSDQPSMSQDETRAACNVLVFYEVRKSSTSVLRIFIYIHKASESIPASVDSYNSHVEGLTNLITMRGVDQYRYSSSLARAVLEEMRMRVVRCIDRLRSRSAARLTAYLRCSSPSSIAKHLG